MFYKVRARIIDDAIPEFYKKLTDGTIASQQPDGEEIIASMKHAVITEPGIVEWFETCYCDTPLHHERITQYDTIFTDISTKTAHEKDQIKGDSFWSYIEAKA